MRLNPNASVFQWNPTTVPVSRPSLELDRSLIEPGSGSPIGQRDATTLPPSPSSLSSPSRLSASPSSRADHEQHPIPSPMSVVGFEELTSPSLSPSVSSSSSCSNPSSAGQLVYSVSVLLTYRDAFRHLMPQLAVDADRHVPIVGTAHYCDLITTNPDISIPTHSSPSSPAGRVANGQRPIGSRRGTPATAAANRNRSLVQGHMSRSPSPAPTDMASGTTGSQNVSVLALAARHRQHRQHVQAEFNERLAAAAAAAAAASANGKDGGPGGTTAAATSGASWRTRSQNPERERSLRRHGGKDSNDPGGPGGWRQAPVANRLHRSDNKWKLDKADRDEMAAAESAILILLNKLTPESFERLSTAAGQIPITCLATLDRVCGRMFDKAIDEASFASLYAQFFSRLAGHFPTFDDENGRQHDVRTVIITRCYDQLIADTPAVDGDDDDAEEQRCKIRRHQIGNIVLMGELFKHGLLAEQVVHESVLMLLSVAKDQPEPDDIEALVAFLRTVGKHIDGTAPTKMNSYFDTIGDMIATPDLLAPRIRFMLKDLVDLRRNRWKLRRAKIVDPKMLDDVRREEERQQAQLAAHNRNLSNRANTWERPPRKPIGAAPTGSGSGSGSATSTPRKRGQQTSMAPAPAPVPAPERAAIRLAPWANLTQRPATVAPSTPPPSNAATTTFSWTNRVKSTPIVPDEDDDDDEDEEIQEQVEEDPEVQRKVTALVKEFYSCADIQEAILCAEELDSEAHRFIVETLFTIAFDMKDEQRELLGRIMEEFLGQDVISCKEFFEGTLSVIENLDDISIDIPRAPTYLATCLAHLIGQGVVSLPDLIHGVQTSARSGRLLLQVLEALKDEMGNDALVNMWKQCDLVMFKRLFAPQDLIPKTWTSLIADQGLQILPM